MWLPLLVDLRQCLGYRLSDSQVRTEFLPLQCWNGHLGGRPELCQYAYRGEARIPIMLIADL